MRMNKKAQGLSLNMVIVAAIALVVLVVIVVIFTGRLGSWGAGVAACKGTCKESCGDGETVSIGDKCAKVGDKEMTCCIAVSK